MRSKRLPLVTALALAWLAVTALPAGAELRLEKVLPLDPGGRFVLDTDAGSVEIEGATANGVEVLITSSRDDIEQRYEIRVSERQGQAVLEVERRHRGWSSRSDDLHFKIRVPRQADVEIDTSGGAIELRSLDGSADLETSGGAIRAEQVTGRLDADTSGGPIDVRDVGGDARLETSGGSIEVERVDGALEADTSGGRIRVAAVRGDIRAETSGGSITIVDAGGKVIADTSGGPVDVAFSAGNAAGGSLSSSGGSVTAHLDPSVSLEIDAHTSGGSVDADLPLTLQGRSAKGTLRGTLNGGGAVLKLRSSGGGIRVRSN